VLPEGIWQSFLADGLIAGVGSVLVFLPQILILFLFILLLEDSGYMARAAFLMDRIMGGAGLHGRAFIPLLSSFACAIPGIMATRVIDNKRDRLTTILVAPLMTCSARIPVYTLIIGAFIPRDRVGLLNLQGLVMFGLYAAGIVSALAVSFVIRVLLARRGRALHDGAADLQAARASRACHEPVVYPRPIFLQRAGTDHPAADDLIWVLSTFPYPPEGATGPAIDYSLRRPIGHRWSRSSPPSASTGR
jgi:ferrous iron transport protein B